MQTHPECYPCLLALIRQAVELATADRAVQAEAQRQARLVLETHLPDGLVPARIATRFHEVIKQATGNPDPFGPLKKREMAFARHMAGYLGLARPMGLRKAALVAVAGNALDFFREHEAVGRELACRLTLAVDDLDEAWGGLQAGQNVLYLADNAGEQYFDAPLLGALAAAGCRVTYAVKERPVQNDLAVADVDRGCLPAGMELVSTGGAAVGLELAASSAGFRALLARAALVVAKGMGHYETIDELRGKRVLVLLKAKCRPVAAGLAVAKDSFVARLITPNEDL